MSQAALGVRAESGPVGYREKIRLWTGIVSLFATTVALTLVAVAMAPLLWGWQPLVVSSGSMAPAIRAGDIVIASPSDGLDLAPGTVITFESSLGLVTHRIIAVNEQGRYVTAGDAARSADSSPVASDQVVGIGRILVPFAGYPAAKWRQGEQPIAAAIVLGFAALIIMSRFAHPEDSK